MHFLRTPKNRLTLLLFGIIVIVLQPAFTIAHYTWNLSHNAYPSDADNIGIAIVSEIFFWLILAPIAITFLVRLTKHYQGALALSQKTSFTRRLLGINIIFGVLLCFVLLPLYDVFAYGNLPMLIDVPLLVYLLLCGRAIAAGQWKAKH